MVEGDRTQALVNLASLVTRSNPGINPTAARNVADALYEGLHGHYQAHPAAPSEATPVTAPSAPSETAPDTASAAPSAPAAPGGAASPFLTPEMRNQISRAQSDMEMAASMRMITSEEAASVNRAVAALTASPTRANLVALRDAIRAVRASHSTSSPVTNGIDPYLTQIDQVLAANPS
jgi:hypothetical protein